MNHLGSKENSIVFPHTDPDRFGGLSIGIVMEQIQETQRKADVVVECEILLIQFSCITPHSYL